MRLLKANSKHGKLAQGRQCSYDAIYGSTYPRTACPTKRLLTFGLRCNVFELLLLVDDLAYIAACAEGADHISATRMESVQTSCILCSRLMKAWKRKFR